MAALRTAEIEALVTVNTDDVDRADKKIKATGERIEKNPFKVDGDGKGAVAAMDRVEKQAKKLVSERAVVKLDADIDRAEKNLQRAQDRLEDLHVRAEGGLDVTADVKRAEANIQKLERSLDGLRKARNIVDVDVDPEPAESGLKRFLSLFKRQTESAGDEGGKSLTQGLDSATRGAGEKVGRIIGGDIEDTLVSALAAIPVAGGLVLAGVAVGKGIIGAIQDGLAVEKRTDRLEALTGIDPATASRFARAAGEAYSSVFGESIEANMNTARIATQFRILDPSATARDAQLVIQNLAGIADVLGEDVQPVATTVTTLLRTGLARSSKEAFDILAAGARNGLDRGQDLLDTLTEYPVVLKKLGLDGPQSIGLLNQALNAGARNSDVAADALKEFQIRATDASEASATGFERLGLNAEQMTAKIAAGGDGAREGLQQVLDKLREMEDPVERNAAAVELFGTKAEDLGDALFAMDLSSAVDQLGQVEGAAQRMFDTIASNDATKIEEAGRAIEVAADGIKGALAAAFAEPLADGADWIASNRGSVLQFFRDLVNGALDFGIAANTAVGDFVSGPLEQMVEGLKNARRIIAPFADTSDIDELQDSMRAFGDSTDAGNEKLEEMRSRFNDFINPQIALGNLNDRARDFAAALDGVTAAQDGSAEAAAALRDQTSAAVDALFAQQSAAAAAGEEQGALTDRWRNGAGALAEQLRAMGLTEVEAWELIAAYAGIPESEITEITSNAPDEQSKVQALVDRVNSIPNGSTHISANTGAALGSIGAVVNELSKVKDKTVTVSAISKVGNFVGQLQSIYGKPMARGGVLEFMAQGGVRGGGLKPMEPLAQMVPPSTWRVVGDRSDVPELFAPLDGSARSWALLLEGFRRMPGSPPQMMAQGGITGGSVGGLDARAFAAELGRILAEQPRFHITEVNPIHTDPVADRFTEQKEREAEL
ncbi:phage tail tape measure protein [Microbacterium sp. Yaish 1]|uniref:phage tail tape measure protein n=1 Tax=Microbacterium sp. Yaish 1 TaxID=2025014 RepID=UPI000B9407B3|nr:phage tail tape measure protein [Microbacterium sp. Yaish 1]OYC97206.1 hypothetical protein CI089_01235 [Microbacterium sp. Yaish 1]